MSQIASFLTDFVFPGLLICCGCLGLGVVNALGNSTAGAPSEKPAARAPSVSTTQRTRVGKTKLPVVRPRPRPQLRVAPLRPMVAVTRLRLGFDKGRFRVTDAQRERLRIFLASAKPGAGARFNVVGYGVGRRGQKRAHQRAKRVVALLRQLGVAAASIAAPQVAPDDAGETGPAVTIVIGKQ